MTASDKSPADAKGPAAEIAVMERLSQQGAAWLAGASAKLLRDHPEVKRSGDGRYNAQEIVAWSVGRGQTPTLTDDQIEIALRIAEKFHQELVEEILNPLIALIEDVGGDETVTIGAIFRIIIDDLRGWTGAFPHLFDLAPDELPKKAYVCESCNRLRRGPIWTSADPPVDADIIGATCPRCLRGIGRVRESSRDTDEQQLPRTTRKGRR